MDQHDRSRLERLERMLELMDQVLDRLLEEVLANKRHIFARQVIVELRGIDSEREVLARAQTAEDATRIEIEFSPAYEEYRRARTQLRRVLGRPDDPRGAAGR